MYTSRHVIVCSLNTPLLRGGTALNIRDEVGDQASVGWEGEFLMIPLVHITSIA